MIDQIIPAPVMVATQILGLAVPVPGDQNYSREMAVRQAAQDIVKEYLESKKEKVKQSS